MRADQYMDEVIAPGDRGSRLAKKICFESHKNCPAIIVVPHQPGNFRGPIGWVWQKHILAQLADYDIDEHGNVTRWTMMEEKENDGAGGKLQFHALLGDAPTFYYAGWEILAMTADDFARSGRFPVVYANDLNVKQLTVENFYLYEALMRGYGDALRRIGGVNITGELAIMKNSITAFCDDFSRMMLIANWGASCVGLAHRDKLIDGSQIKPGMIIVGFREPGYRCNGGTQLTNIIQRYFILEKNDGLYDFVAKCARPSTIYAPLLTRVNGWQKNGIIGRSIVNITGIAHISGGGVWEKLGDILPEGVGATLHRMPTPADVLMEAQEISWLYPDLYLSDWQAHSTFHGGCGMLVICHTSADAMRLITEAKKDHYEASVVGITTASQRNEIIIHSRFKEGGILSSLDPA